MSCSTPKSSKKSLPDVEKGEYTVERGDFVDQSTILWRNFENEVGFLWKKFEIYEFLCNETKLHSTVVNVNKFLEEKKELVTPEVLNLTPRSDTWLDTRAKINTTSERIESLLESHAKISQKNEIFTLNQKNGFTDF